MPDDPIISNNNPYGSAEFWFDGDVAFTIDNGVNSTYDLYLGTSDFWHQGLPQGYLQGGRGGEGDSDPNLFITPPVDPGVPPLPPAVKLKTRAYAVILT